MLALSAPRSAGLALFQREHGARSTVALLILHLLGGVRCMYRRRSLRGLVLGPGDDVSPPVGARSSAGIYSTARLLRWRWIDTDGPTTSEVFFFGGMSMKVLM